MNDYPMARFLAREAGGWAEASELPYREAFAWATEKVLRERRELFQWRTLVWASRSALYSMGGTPPPPPEPDEEW